MAFARLPTILLAVVLSSEGCIPMKPTDGGIPAMPAVPVCQKCTSDDPPLLLDWTGATSGTPPPLMEELVAIGVDGCAVDTFTCNLNTGWTYYANLDKTGLLGAEGGTNAKVALTCRGDGKAWLINGVEVKLMECT